MQVCLANQGINVVHRSSLQALEGLYVHYDELRPGDLIYFRDSKTSRYLSHVGIYVGGGKFIHAGQSIGEVAISEKARRSARRRFIKGFCCSFIGMSRGTWVSRAAA